jgi:hypothetical protein
MWCDRDHHRGQGIGFLMSNERDSVVEISEMDREIMRRLLRMRREQQKFAPKPTTPKGEAQRRRREQERA